MTQLIDGKAFAAKLRADIAERVKALPFKPGLSVVLVGTDPASEVYVRNKALQTIEVGMRSFEHKLPEATTQAELLALIAKLNADKQVHGILVQLPLPSHIDKQAVLNAIDPNKDVDGFHPANVAKLERGEAGFVPCTPLGCLMLLKDTMPNLIGKQAVIMGRSNIVGKPMAALLRNAGTSVNVIHSQTTPEDRASWLKQADIVVVAVGKPNILSGQEIKPGAVVIDVGINRVGGKLVGDVDFQSCQGIAGAITPVPGGVGPMTIACLLENTYRAALARSRSQTR